jgi:hemoglobin
MGTGRHVSRDVSRPLPSCDLDCRAEIAEMVRRFYQDVAQDDLLGPVFDDVARVDWSEHLVKLTEFWSRALLGTGDYAGSPLRAHAAVHARSRFTDEHFDRWLQLFHDTVELGWVGPRAEKALALADRVAEVHRKHLARVATRDALRSTPRR